MALLKVSKAEAALTELVTNPVQLSFGIFGGLNPSDALVAFAIY